ncbi:MAG: ABC transporter permease [ANME-2 cluster archaeon]|jgi:peptide/nickel transport system permease protein|nr:ABC transporter permease [ANME-2 cluster archaeon]
MLKGILKRLGIVLFVVVGATALVFFMLHYIPGETADVMARYIFIGNIEIDPSNEDVALISQYYELDKPLIVQYVSWLSRSLQGDLGMSYKTGQPVLEEIMIRLPATIKLAVVSVLISLIIGIPLGIVAAIRQNTIVDYICSTSAVIGVSIPNFWLALILILVFSIYLDLTPVMGSGSVEHLILPSITLGTGMAAVIARLTRSSMLEVIRQDYVRTARGKGLAERTIIVRHAMKNALIPVITIIGLEMGHLLGGTVIVETIFAWPGIGKLLIDAISQRDLPLIQGCVVFITIMYVFVNLIVDISYSIFDPRISYER